MCQRSGGGDGGIVDRARGIRRAEYVSLKGNYASRASERTRRLNRNLGGRVVAATAVDYIICNNLRSGVCGCASSGAFYDIAHAPRTRVCERTLGDPLRADRLHHSEAPGLLLMRSLLAGATRC